MAKLTIITFAMVVVIEEDEEEEVAGEEVKGVEEEEVTFEVEREEVSTLVHV